ncbi:N-formylglutamate amidohydrolase [Mesorhizobium xinjiangense]|uniref:N-formylglutamate amidohydrolase n=1 Tax=Mesorhizobium xinjiangense TaxID=2678685 RepID=UPI0012EE9EE5|nr:N-formylglutamate amidohydrolase [Mesorhizobium xinjiangense]
MGETDAGLIVETINPQGTGQIVLACEHASSFIPPEFGNLGLTDTALESHIAWDPGALAVAQRLSSLLDAPLVAQRVSRLVYDCNRPLSSPGAIPVRSEVHAVPGNAGLSEAERSERANRFCKPFRKALDACLDARMESHGKPLLVTIHSFTPIYFGVRREVELGILHDGDTRLADAMLALIEGNAEPVVRRNEPYGPDDGVTHTLKMHGLSRGIPNVMLEIRNDLIANPTGQAEWAARLAALLRRAVRDLSAERGERSHA